MESIPLKAARHPFSAFRDKNGVPHVEAPDWLHALYALGYLHAIDRPTQIYFARAVATGQAAQRISNRPDLVDMDILLRRAGLHRHLTREASLLGEEISTQLEWYCSGVNDGMNASGRTLPMWVTRFQPLPWDATAVLSIGNLLSFAGLSVNEQNSQRELTELIHLGVSETHLRELFRPYLDGVDLDLLREIHFPKSLSNDALELLADLPRLASSNAWAVDGSRSQTGYPLLAGDPHLEVNRLPPIWYEATLNWGDGDYAMGATLPGCPIMAVGRNPQLAWSVTYMHANTSDFFIEDCRQDEEGAWQYRREHDWIDFQVRNETIERKGSDPLELQIYENDQGVLMRAPEENQPGKYLSVAWVGSHPGGGRSIGTWLNVMKTSSCAQAMTTVRDCPHPSLIWVFADREGHIGSQASGWIPNRGDGHHGFVPVPAWEVKNHWNGLLSPELLPSEFDPPHGFVASANEELYRTDGVPLHSHALPDYRKRRIVERLMALPQANLQDMFDMQYDVVSRQAGDLLPIFLPLIKESPLKEALTAWDYRFSPQSHQASLFQSLYRNVLLEVFGQESGIGRMRMIYLSTRLGYSSLVLTAADAILKKPNSAWWKDRSKAELIQRAADKTAEESSQPWSQINSFHFVNRFFGGSRAGRLLGFKSAQVPMPGCHATIFQGHLLATATRESTFAPSYHFVTDLGTDHAWTNLPGGPSESRFSKWYKIDIPRWIGGKYKELAPKLDRGSENAMPAPDVS